MRNTTNLLIAVLGLFIAIPLSSCKKEEKEDAQPTACFAASKTTVMVGESFDVTNCSSNAFSFLWEDGDGFTTNERNRTILYQSTGTYNLRLTAYSESKKKQHTVSSQITVIPATGKVTFWTASNQVSEIIVTINGMNQKITKYYSSGTPECDGDGCATFTLSPGTYSFTATDGNYNWNGVVSTEVAGCNRQKLTL